MAESKSESKSKSKLINVANKTASWIAHGCLYFFTFLKIVIALILLLYGYFILKKDVFTTAKITHLDDPDKSTSTTRVTVVYGSTNILATLTINGMKHHIGETINIFYDPSSSPIVLTQGTRSFPRYLILFSVLLLLFAIVWFFFVRYLLGKKEKDQTSFQKFITYFYAGDCIFSLFS